MIITKEIEEKRQKLVSDYRSWLNETGNANGTDSSLHFTALKIAKIELGNQKLIERIEILERIIHENQLAKKLNRLVKK